MRKKNANESGNTSSRKEEFNEEFVDVETAPLMDVDSERRDV
jgi:hypothetical protein